MSTTTSKIRENEITAKRGNFLASLEASDTESNVYETTERAYYVSPRARKIAFLSVLAAILFLGSLATYVWYGFYQ